MKTLVCRHRGNVACRLLTPGKLSIALVSVLLAGCSGMHMSGMDNGSPGALQGSEYFNEQEPWTPRTAVFTQRTFNPRDPHHGG
jgi:hypothetical protein